MEYFQRKHYLWQGFLVASIPALLFVPAVAFLTLCPPNTEFLESGLWVPDFFVRKY